MAKDKKSFILYKDQRTYFEKLSDEDAGKLIKHIFSYISDENPKPESLIIDLSFEPIKLALKRDLKKYEKRVETARENGSKGGRPKNPTKPKKPNGLFENPTKPKKADNDSDNDIYMYYTDNFLLSEVESIDSSKLTAKNKLSYHILTGLVARVYKETDEKLKTKMTAEPIVDTIRKLIKIDKYSDKDIILVLAYLKFKDQFWLTQGMPSFATARKKKDGQTKFEKIHFKATSETKRDEQFYQKVKKQIQWYEIQLNK